MKIYKLLVFVLIFASCSPIYVNYDYERETKFENYKTYNYYSDMQTGLNELDTKRLVMVMDNALQSRGFTKSESPDFFINMVSSEYENINRNTVGVGVGGGGRNVGGGISIGLPIGQSKMSRQIVFEFVDENNIGLFWQAVSETGFNPKSSPEKREAKLRAIVEKVLAKYPPK